MKQCCALYRTGPHRVHHPVTVLDTVERLCTAVAIITKPGKLVWQGDITVLANRWFDQLRGQEFRALEPLFLHLTGQHYADLNWL